MATKRLNISRCSLFHVLFHEPLYSKRKVWMVDGEPPSGKHVFRDPDPSILEIADAGIRPPVFFHSLLKAVAPNRGYTARRRLNPGREPACGIRILVINLLLKRDLLLVFQDEQGPFPKSLSVFVSYVRPTRLMSLFRP